jgi:membrane protein implicated in regulation of membrane protease activity
MPLLAALTFPQLLLIIGLILVFFALLVGVEAVIDLLLVGSILVISGLVGSLIGGTPVSLVLATLLSGLYFVYGRTTLRHKLKTNTHSTNTDRLLGQTGLVTREISPKKAGTVKIDDEEWRAASNQKITVGTEVIVSAIRGVTLDVKLAENK